ncbi:hypothetical protein B0920_20835 [Massilia sp. KIM]|uniref:PhaM family polyhydroxyalkanoate granule multifunctional regulatory protein n=1 Tax=Massilia sp. KIM TaxID=1955422 RepID=UPI00098ED2E9|nr:PhaM family polyhydroxyalkanoate granule multifunctional regulatory protein [Massilia sp. KIM]OON59732.1 hypothetical protein B0920_20835 [Massilia sp. KIM]
MLKPPMPNLAGMTDTLEFVKNLWGSMNIPGVTVPGMTGNSLSTDELDKKIADLKAVESWLNLNIGMLRGTIQALEVQRGTLATLKSMGESMAQAMSQAGSTGEAAMAPFTQFFAQAAQAAHASPSASATAPAGAAPAAAQPAQPAQPPKPEDAATAAGPGAAAMPAAVAWWNVLQEQFRQAVASTMPPDGAAGKNGGSPLDVSGGAPQPGPAADAPDAPAGNGANGRGARGARGKADKA